MFASRCLTITCVIWDAGAIPAADSVPTPALLGRPAFGPTQQAGDRTQTTPFNLAQLASATSTEAIRSDGRHLEASASTCAERAHLNQRSEPTDDFYPFAI